MDKQYSVSPINYSVLQNIIPKDCLLKTFFLFLKLFQLCCRSTIGLSMSIKYLKGTGHCVSLFPLVHPLSFVPRKHGIMCRTTSAGNQKYQRSVQKWRCETEVYFHRAETVWIQGENVVDKYM